MSSAASPVIAVLSQGCAANFGDGEKIARALSAQHPDCSISFEFPTEQPFAFYLNVCTVKGNGTALKLLQQAVAAFPQAPVFITGCAPKDFQEEARKISDKITFTSLKALESLDSIAPEGLQNDMRILRQSPFVGIVNIEEGCLDACAFCSVRQLTATSSAPSSCARLAQKRCAMFLSARTGKRCQSTLSEFKNSRKRRRENDRKS